MASTYNSLGIELMQTGEQAGLWGGKTNTNLNLVQETWGYISIDMAGADVTLAMTSGSSSNARNFILELTGTLAANRVLNIPAQAGSPAANIEKAFLVLDKTDRNPSFTLTFKVTSATGVVIPKQGNILCYHNGTDIMSSGLLSTRGTTDATLATQPTYTFPAADGSADQMLSTDGSGALSFVTPSAGISTGKAIAMAMIFG